MKKITTLILGLAVVVSCRETTDPSPAPEPYPPNVVFLVGDGFGVGAWSLAREWARTLGQELALDDPEAIGFLDPRSLDSPVTDSPAAATAWSTGALAERFSVGRTPTNAPLLFPRLVEAGRPHGLVTTSRVTHGTPAPFYARVAERGQENEIAAQLVTARPSVALGGGLRHFRPKDDGGSRRDGRDLVAEAESAGTAVLLELVDPLPTDRPVLGLFAASHVPHEVDRTNEPDLAEMATAAVRRLEQEGSPWFLLVEEGRIDSAGHDHDGPSIAFDTVRLDRALAAILEEVDASNTLVVVAADHATASPTLLEFGHAESLSVVTASVEVMEERIFRGQPWRGTPRALEEAALPVLDEGARHTALTGTDLDRLLTARSHYDRRTAIGQAISRRFGISFIPYGDHLASDEVHGHTAELVPVRAWGPRAGEIRGVRDHAELGRWLVDVMQISVPAPDTTATAN